MRLRSPITLPHGPRESGGGVQLCLASPPDPASTLSYEGSSGYVPPSFAGVEEGLAVIDRGGPEKLTSDTLREDLKWFTIQQRTLEAMSARWLGELDRREAGPRR